MAKVTAKDRIEKAILFYSEVDLTKEYYQKLLIRNLKEISKKIDRDLSEKEEEIIELRKQLENREI